MSKPLKLRTIFISAATLYTVLFVRCPFDVRHTFSVTAAAQRSASYWPCFVVLFQQTDFRGRNKVVEYYFVCRTGCGGVAGWCGAPPWLGRQPHLPPPHPRPRPGPPAILRGGGQQARHRVRPPALLRHCLRNTEAGECRVGHERRRERTDRATDSIILQIFYLLAITNQI